MDDDVEVVEQDPTALPLTLPANWPDSGLAQPFLDLLDDCADLTVVGR
jgi:hypothetical protein